MKRFYFVPDYAYLWEAKAGIAIHYKKFIRKLENIYETYGDTKFEGLASMWILILTKPVALLDTKFRSIFWNSRCYKQIITTKYFTAPHTTTYQNLMVAQLL